MQGRPPRSRNERNQPQSIISEQELKMELEKQAEQKRQERRLKEIQDKEELLRHYQNNALAMPQADPELQDFVQQKQESLSYQYQQQFPQESSKSEQQRQQRLKLREEERLRRQNGLSSAYEQNKEPLPFQLERQLKENYNNNNQFIENDPKRALKEDLFTPAEVVQRTLQQNFYQPIDEPIQQDFPSGSKQSFRAKESQKQYRQELDKQLTQKPKDLREQVKPYSQQTIREEENFLDRFSQQQQRPQSGRMIQQNQQQIQPTIEEKRRQMADQVMQQLIEQNNNNYPISQQSNNNYHATSTPITQDTNQYFRRSSSRQNIDQQSQQQLEQKRKYKEELDRQIAEKNQQKEREKMLRKQQDLIQQPESRQSGQQRQTMMPQSQQYDQNNYQMPPAKNSNSMIPIYQEQNQYQIQNQQLPTPGTRQSMTPYDPYQGQQQMTSPNQRQMMTPQQDQYAGRQSLTPMKQDPSYNQLPAQQVISPGTRQLNSQQQDQFQFNEYEYQMPNAPRSEESQQQNYARTRHVTSTVTQEESQKQKMQRLQYAEELRRQVEEQKNKKKLEEDRKKEEEQRLQKKIEKDIEEEKKFEEQKQKIKAQEVVEHQVANKQIAKRLQEQQKKREEVPKNEFEDLDTRGPQMIIDSEEPKQLSEERKRKRDLLFGQDDETQQQQMNLMRNQLNNKFNNNNVEDQLPINNQQFQQQNNYNQLQGQGQGFIQQPSFNNLQQNFQYQIPYQGFQPQMPNYINLNQQLQNQQFSQFQQAFPLQQQFFDQVQYYHNALFNPQSRLTPQNMQIHQNYLLQLQQNRQEIEIVRQILEEKLRIQQLEMQNKLLVEEYRNKVKEIKNEEQLFQKEIQKLQMFLAGKQQVKEPLNPQVFQSALQLSIIGYNQKVPQTQPQVQHLLPKHAQPKGIPSQVPEAQAQSILEEDVELPGDSDYVAIENNSIFQQQVAQQKSYLQDIKDYRVASQVQNSQKFSIIQNIDEFQMMSLEEQQDQQDQQYEEDNQEDQDLQEKNYTEQLNGFDVNLLRTQDYMNMFRQNIQSQSRQQELKIPIHMLRQNSNSLENMSQIESKPLFSQWSQIAQSDNQKTQAMIKQFPEKVNFQDGQPQQEFSQSQLAVSASIPLSRLQGKEVQMSEAVFQQDPNTLILPEDDNEDDLAQLQKPHTAGENNKPQTPMSNYNTVSIRGDYESCGSKKFKKPKTIDIFQKLEVHSKPSSKPINTNPSIQESELKLEEQKIVDMPSKVPPQIQNSELRSNPHEQGHISQNYQSMSNYTQLNPLTSQTTFIVQQENKQNFLQEIDQSKISVLNQSKRLINTPSNPPEQRRTTSRKAKQLFDARKDDLALNQQLDVLKESQESEPNGNSNLYKPYDFKYEESVHQFDFQQQQQNK